MPVAITMRQPKPQSLKFVNEFSKKTGDYASLSLPDMKVLALTYELEVETRGGAEHLRTEPQKIITEGAAKKGTNTAPPTTEGFYLPKAQCEECASASSGISSRSSSPDDTNFENGLSELLPSDPSLPNFNVSSSQVPNICWQHLVLINSFLEEHSYISGHVPTGKDFMFHTALTRTYPQFCSIEAIANCKSSEDIKTVHENKVCPFLSTFPCIRRWALHASSFTEEERTLYPCSSLSLEELLHDFEEIGQQMEEEKPVQPDQEGEEEPPHSDAPAEPAPVDVSSLSLSQQSETADHTEEGESHPKELIDTHLAEEDGDDEESDVDDDNASEDESDDDGWITPSNLKKHRLKNNPFQYACEEEPEEDVQVACMTADFAVQNVLKHIGLSVMGVDGLLIKHLKTFILRCHACFKTTSIMTKIFCPNCGNKTLKKVSVTLNPDGSQKIWINTKKQINIRGMKYSLPTPKGGKHGRNPILVEDQREAKRFSSKMSRKKINPLHEDFDPHHIPFAVHDVYSRAAQLGYIAGKNHYHHYWEKRNPNEPKRTTGKKKKNPA
ncbi:RNA-binding protein NOB1-like isoform X2 [Homarus americanus]|nr:RNA-binding protein NOB1-like isoform X2 [Homarus americanus]XP_042207078.1 RNA-binding protein NOB1-like isoform X2 [Homarus americanus]